MLEIDVDKIEKYLERIEEYTKILKGLRPYTFDEFKSDPKNYGSAERFLQVAIESCIDIGHHFISRLGLKRPEGYREVFTILGDAGLIPKDFVNTMRQMAGFRNLLVHHYYEIRLEDVYRIIQNNLQDFERFNGYVAKYLKQYKSKGEKGD